MKYNTSIQIDEMYNIVLNTLLVHWSMGDIAGIAVNDTLNETLLKMSGLE